MRFLCLNLDYKKGKIKDKKKEIKKKIQEKRAVKGEWFADIKNKKGRELIRVKVEI